MAVNFLRNSDNLMFRLINCSCQVISDIEKIPVQLQREKFSLVLINWWFSKISVLSCLSEVKFWFK